MPEYQERLFRETPGSYFLFGPRGTGKTLWLRHHHAGACRIDLLDSETYRTYVAHPEKIRDVLERQGTGKRANSCASFSRIVKSEYPVY